MAATYLTAGFEVKPCPFCGKFDQVGGGNVDAMNYGVYCRRCRAEVSERIPETNDDNLGWEDFERSILAKAVERWNKRAE